jgi:endonuclease-3
VKKENIDKIFAIFAKQNPQPKTELEYVNEFTLLVAVVLSAQSTDIQVNKATKALFAKFDTPQKMLKLGENGLKKYINTIGLFNAKAKNVIALSKTLINEHKSQVPDNFNDLIKLAGVGQKTANVFLNCAHGHLTIAVDTHVFRVANRTGIARGKDVFKTEIALMKNIPKKWQKHAHHWLILHGRYICKARKPECAKCLISDLCEFKGKVF